MQFIRDRVLAGEVMMGIGANLGSSLTVEMYCLSDRWI